MKVCSRMASDSCAKDEPAQVSATMLGIWHPVFAALTALALLRIAARGDLLPRNSRFIVATVVAQTALGIVNLLLLAPLWLQMAHLVMSNLLWMAVVWSWLDARASGGLARAA